MSEHRATVRWELSGDSFTNGRYSREHRWIFDGGVTVPASPAPTSVRPPFSNPDFVDPEEAYVAALSSCHMLTFLYLASKDGVKVRRYEDDALGRMTPNERGVLWVSTVELSPRIEYDGAAPPSVEQVADLHHRAHEECYLANSVKTVVTVAAAASSEASPSVSRSTS